ncbi:hypothetical protein [Mycobacteroides abscessus]|uniref:hypothetical protein n=1 Tax=Mycobacteroides abscessus TaxID=36809 RepID=UPI0005DE468D|nr:hypothetical protein [Mycobacteroides abscessus]CPR78933.1 Uncharacterised protein [Mycobacteroides abscessus]CPR88099.1 Uncharacterised protein [Mycobacteroides abscessus]CPS43098.1 Uncharacterised protein [Mycobacteroides abscessus]CPV02865.1 Uncharacterised protein [Mycobacteroides abscessus]
MSNAANASRIYPNVQMVANALDLCDTLAEAAKRLGVGICDPGDVPPFIAVSTERGPVRVTEYAICQCCLRGAESDDHTAITGLEIEYAD